jgi:rubrerythrin
MIDELRELLDMALDREIAAQAFYIAGQKKTEDPGAISLMKELETEEEKHYEWIKKFKDAGGGDGDWSPKILINLNISENLVDTSISAQAGLQDVITAAMKREEYSVEFYSKIKQAMASRSGKDLCDRLHNEERKHKAKLEKFYDELFNREN